MTTEEENLAASFQAAVDQYKTACQNARENRGDPIARMERRQAGERVREMRTYWRNVGAAVGERAVGPDGQAATGVRIVNGDGSIDGTAVRQ